MNFGPGLGRFARRVRLLRAWLGLAIGLSVGAMLALVWTVLDWFRVFYAEWSYLGWLIAICGVLGLLVGLVRRIPATALADSIDRRANLKNRLSTASERASEQGAFDEALREDAFDHLGHLQPARLYPIKFNRWHAGALAFSLLAACIFMLGNTPVLLTPAAKAARAKMQEQAAQVERVAKPLEEAAKKGETNPDEKKLAEELRKLSKDLHKARIDPEEALRRQNELSKEAQKLTDQRIQQAQQNMQTAQASLDQMQKADQEKSEDQKNNAQKSDSKTTQEKMDALKQAIQSMKSQMSQSSMSQQQQKEMQDQLSEMQNSEKLAQSLQDQMNQIQKELHQSNLSQQQRDKLEKQMQSLQKQMQQALKLSKAAQDMLDRMMKNPLYQKLQEMLSKMAKANQQMQKTGQQQLSKQQIEQMQKELEKMAKQLSNDKEMSKFLQAMMDALKNMKMGNGMLPIPGMMPGMMPGNMPGMPGGMPMELPMAGAPTQDTYFANTGFINKGKGEKSRGSTYLSTVTGQSRDVPGQNAYIEMRGPTGQGLRSSIPYEKVLPSYKRKADEALNRQEIPPEHQKRVKKYFESLGQ